MDPEEPLVSPVTVSLANGPSGILIEEFADHGLRDCMDNSGVSRSTKARAVCCRVSSWRDRGNGMCLRAIDKYTMIGRH